MTRILDIKKSLSCVLIAFALFLITTALIPDALCLKILRSKKMFPYAHFVTYAVLSFTFCLYLKFQRQWMRLKMHTGTVILMAFLLSSLWGGATEILQMYAVDRHPDLGDFYIDLIGSAGGVFFFYISRNASDWYRTLKLIPVRSRTDYPGG